MKKLMFISLLVIPFCKADDPDQSWYQAVQNKPDWQQQRTLSLIGKQIQAIPDNLDFHNLEWLHLNDNQIQAIPANLTAPYLRTLFLGNNSIDYVDPQIINQFPRLNRLELNKNPLTQENVDQLRAATLQANRHILIVANDIGPQYAYAGSMKPAKRK